MKLTALETELMTALGRFYGYHEENAHIARHLAEQADMLRRDAGLPLGACREQPQLPRFTEGEPGFPESAAEYVEEMREFGLEHLLP